MGERIRRVWFWFLPLLIILPMFPSANYLNETYYIKFERTNLLNTMSAVPCAKYTPVLNRSPEACDLAIPAVKTADGTVIETYVFSDGSRGTVESKNGQQPSAGGECALAYLMWGAAIAGVMLALSGMMYSFRTGGWGDVMATLSERPGVWLGRLIESPLSDAEFVILAYGLAIGFVCFVALLATSFSCKAVASGAWACC